MLEDTDGDGKADTFTVFAEGLNIPSGIAVGHGGVWVANSPDILFLQDTDGDGKADQREVVVTGFGRADTHELPNSLTWGPDGWLYGWNGVFNPAKVASRGKTYEFTCAIFRIHPRTRDFELFCEGTSNPWGIAWDLEGSAFASACVIDHLWHLTETGYYHRQGGPYPPYTWKIESIVEHRHQKAAYCGIHFFDSDAYPPAVPRTALHGQHPRQRHQRRSSSNATARPTPGRPSPTSCRANDAWFMPVVAEDRPRRLPLHPRLVRPLSLLPGCQPRPGRASIGSRAGSTASATRTRPARARFDLAAETRRSAHRPARAARTSSTATWPSGSWPSGTTPAIQRRAGNAGPRRPARRKARMHALWAWSAPGRSSRTSSAAARPHRPRLPRLGRPRGREHARGSTGSPRPDRRAGRRPAPDVRLQVAIAARKIEGIDPFRSCSTCWRTPATTR